MIVGVTGANGFVGRALIARLGADGVRVVPLVRRACGLPNEHVLGDIAAGSGLTVPPVDAVVHLAALAHTNIRDPQDAERQFHAINVDGTKAVLDSGIAAGARHFVFVSSVKVNGETSTPERPFTEADTPQPADAYGRSKWAAEQVVEDRCRASGMAFTIVRPPLVYGPGARANMARLAKYARSPLPLPLGGINNRRSLVAADNLVDLLSRVIADRRAANQTYLVRDGDDVSTSQLIELLGTAQGKRPRLWSASIVEMLVRLLGAQGLHNRLFSSLHVDDGKVRRELRWAPVTDVQSAMRAMFSADAEAS